MIASLLVSLPLICGQTSFADKSSLESALAEWCNDPAAAASTHGNISTWGVSAVTDMASLVYNAPCRSTFDEDIDDWDVGQVTTMHYMFGHANSFNRPLNAWAVGKVSAMTDIFRSARAFNQSLDAWDVSQVTSMYRVFYDADAFNQPLEA